VKESASSSCSVKSSLKEQILELKINVIAMKCIALTFFEVVSFPLCDDPVIQKCPSVSWYGKYHRKNLFNEMFC
jgi:hypothetical protein